MNIEIQIGVGSRELIYVDHEQELVLKKPMSNYACKKGEDDECFLNSNSQKIFDFEVRVDWILGLWIFYFKL